MLGRVGLAIGRKFARFRGSVVQSFYEQTRELSYVAGPRRGQLVLLCGDGDLSFSASIAPELADIGAKLTATVLESCSQHRQVYRDSTKNIEMIEKYGHTVRFETDATRLETYRDLGGPFDQIQFNFPHWRGKTNAKHNRNLLESFFKSSSTVLQPAGHVHVALMKHQGGANSATLSEWKQSWMAARYAALYDLLLVGVVPFFPAYNVSAYQWLDRAFHIQSEPQLYIFSAPGALDHSAPPELQLFCHFELYLQSPNDTNGEMGTDIIGQRLQKHVQERLPQGWRAQTHFVRYIDVSTTARYSVQGKLAAFKVLFFGQERVIRHDEAERFRILVQQDMHHHGIPIIQRGKWCISNVCPSSVLQGYLPDQH